MGHGVSGGVLAPLGTKGEEGPINPDPYGLPSEPSSFSES